MPSSTSSSNARSALAAGFVAFCLLGVAGGIAVRLPSMKAVSDTAILSEAPASDWYIDERPGEDPVSHWFLYHLRTPVRRATILLLGSSRILAGVDGRMMSRFCKERDMAFYNLGFGQREDDLFPLRLIEKHDLRPRVVIVDADPFFTETMSPYAERVIGGTPFAEWKNGLEYRGRFAASRLRSQVAPRLHPVAIRKPSLRHGRAILRSIADGSWYFVDAGQGTIPVRPDMGLRRVPEACEERCWKSGSLAEAKRVLAFFQRRGTTMILTFVPSALPFLSREAVRDLARRLGVPALLPDSKGLMTLDGSHLDPKSSRRFTRAFLRALDRRPVGGGFTGEPLRRDVD